MGLYVEGVGHRGGRAIDQTRNQMFGKWDGELRVSDLRERALG
jgi:hypothetical protein